jgi:hypothetical protein
VMKAELCYYHRTLLHCSGCADGYERRGNAGQILHGHGYSGKKA